jgi:hypothetical protein
MIMRFKSLFYPLFFVSLCLASCEFKCSVGDSSADNDEKNKPVKKEDGTLLYNGIQLEANGLKVNKAYLVVKEDGKRVPADNIVDIKKGVKLLLLIDGWQEKEGRAWPGASIKVVADNGETVLEQADMFAEYDQTGVSPEDAKVIGLSVYFSKWTAERPVSLDVSFRVWDKRSDAFIKGSYIIHTK